MGRKVRVIDYLKVDLLRAFVSWKFLIGVLGVAFVMYIASMEGIASDTNVTYVVWLIVYGMLFMISLVFSAFPYSGCFCEDFEQKYAYSQIERGSLRNYAIAKTIAIMLVTATTMMLGVMFYVSLLHMKLPWFDEADAICQSALELGGFRAILQKGWYLAYFALFGFQYGVMAGILALLASYVSLYINNKLLTLSVPFMGFYLISYYSRALFGDYEKINLLYVFNATFNVWNNDLISFGYAILVGLFFAVILGSLIFLKLKRKINYG